MDEDVFNMTLRKFLKNVGITSQREIENAVRTAIDEGKLSGDESIGAKVTLTIDSLGLSTDVNGKIDLK